MFETTDIVQFLCGVFMFLAGVFGIACLASFYFCSAVIFAHADFSTFGRNYLKCFLPLGRTTLFIMALLVGIVGLIIFLYKRREEIKKTIKKKMTCLKKKKRRIAIEPIETVDGLVFRHLHEHVYHN